MKIKAIQKPQWAEHLMLNQPTLFVDPGLGGTGIAFFHPVSGTPLVMGSRASGKGDWLARVFEQTSWYVNTIIKLDPKPSQIVIEYPKLFGGSSSSLASVQRGDIGKLTTLCGALAFAGHERTWAKTIFVHPDVWKGQLPKDVVLARIRRQLNLICPDHVGDAVGMSLSAQGLL